MKITYSFASRSRPDKFFAALDNIREMSASDNYEVIAKLDTDDKEMTTHGVLTRLLRYPEVKVKWGTSKNKVHAINRDLEDMTGEILMCHSDDMVFIKHGFDDIIRQEMSRDMYLHFPDGYANNRLSTYSIMHRDYYRRFGFIYNPAYNSVWCDNEQMDVAKLLKRYKYVDKQIFEHVHPSAGKAKKDPQYSKTEQFYQVDKATYMKRKNVSFGIDTTKILSILICALYERGLSFLQRLIDVLKPQGTESVEFLICLDNRGEHTTGWKRNTLLEAAKGKYTVFIDDDDLVSETYVSDILEAAKSDTDAIVFKGWMTTNGKNKRSFELSKDFPYSEKDNVYLRYPNHIVPIRATIAKQFKFPDLVYEEDYAWATAIHNSGLIKTETRIDKELYFYLFRK